MITGRFVAPGKTRTCPHCRATILDSATVCPGCHHHLRFDSSGAGQRVQPAATPLRVEGTVRHPSHGGSWEYSVVLAIRNDRGEEIARQVVGVGALQPGDARTFSLAVEVFKPAELKESKPQPAEAAQRAGGDAKSPELRASGRPGLPPTAPGPSAPRPAMPAAAPGSAPPKWPLPSASTSTSGRYPAAPASAGTASAGRASAGTPSAGTPSAGTSGRYPAMPAPASAPGKVPPAAAPSAPAPNRTASGPPLRPPQPSSLNGGSAAPARGTGPGIQPKRS